MANQMSISAAAAEYTCGRSLVEGTKGKYRGKLNTMKVFFLSRGYEDCLDTSKEGINIPIRNEIVEELFGWISVNTDLPKKRKRFEPDAGEEEDFGYDEDPEMVDIVAEQFHEEPDHKKESQTILTKRGKGLMLSTWMVLATTKIWKWGKKQQSQERKRGK